MRLIDADALREKLIEYIGLTNGFDRAFNEAPTIEIPQWIPCGERLPEKEGDYLVTLYHKYPRYEYKTVEIEEFRNGGFDENLYIKVIAWKQLPKPWKGADDE